LLELLY
jgi:hypothetical protein